eukprot:gb/GECG01003241.1/.p1 GENE.gb/GECG01003241.1/~~gb/GECG01003241.1/.p1  ORF type:complete len:200 (+),score=22.73 gb/GECG01003241.1/:1-600(+)
MSSNKAAGEKKLYRRIYTRHDVSLHNSPDDCWVVLFDKVLELTSLLKDENHGALADPILDYAGRDVSHWFDEKTGDIKYRVDPETHLEVPYTPEGRFIHVPPRDPTTTWRHRDTPWWKDPQYVIGNITQKERKLRIVNTLTSKEDILEVGCEETLEEIRDRFYEFNAHAASYTWKVSIQAASERQEFSTNMCCVCNRRY